MKKINQIILLAVAIFLTSLGAFSQTYTLSPNDTIIVNGSMEDLETLSIQQVNATLDTLNIKWKKISESVPSSWEASVCDNQLCYTSLTDSGTMNPIFPSEYGFLLIHVTPHVNFGVATIRYMVWNINTPLVKDTLTYIIRVSPTAVETTTFEAPFVWLEKDKIHLQNNNGNFDIIRLIDLQGKEIYQSNISNRLEFELPFLPSAIYIIQLVGKQNLYQKKIFYQQ